MPKNLDKRKNYKLIKLYLLAQPSSCMADEGMALVLTLILGMVMLTGISGLLVRQLMTQRLSSKESYRQMAEAAANNGLNRVLGELNNAEPGKSRGFLFNIDNQKDIKEPKKGYKWQLLNTENSPLFSELCLDTSIGLPPHPLQQKETQWPTTEILLNSANEGLREDGFSNINMFYRLRGYSTPGTSGGTESGEAKLIIEGIVRRDGSGAKSYLARSTLERSIYIQNWVDTTSPQDWAVLGATYYELGPIKLKSPGLILWHTNPKDGKDIRKDCDSIDLLSRVKGKVIKDSDLKYRIWPVIHQKQPPTRIFSVKNAKDYIPKHKLDLRVWRFDDKNLLEKGSCKRRIACQRSIHSDNYTTPPKIQNNPAWPTNKKWPKTSIYLREEDICIGKKGDCHIYVDHINLRRSKLLIENSSRPVIVHLLNPTKSTSIDISYNGGFIAMGPKGLMCGVDKNSKVCNNLPERLIIIGDSTQLPNKCNANSHQLVLNGKSLPSAFLFMRNGTVSLANDSIFNGIIWTHSFCSNNHSLTLNDNSQNENLGINWNSVQELWKWDDKGFSGYGRKTTRGVRGTGLDKFQRF